jgi:hypothetical protein
MFKVLAILAGSMTTTAVILSHLDPAASRAVPYPFPEQVRERVQQAVASADTLLRDTWRGVEILTEGEAASLRGARLAAVRHAPEYHFRVSRAGHVAASPAWTAQHPLDTEGTILIALADRAEGRPPSLLQWTALVELVGELRLVVGPNPPPATSLWQVTLSDQAGFDNVLRARLRSAGLLG